MTSVKNGLHPVTPRPRATLCFHGCYFSDEAVEQKVELAAVGVVAGGV